jgi:short-subunit dehydrogenase
MFGMFWKDKVILITGASSGIGAELARQISPKGAILGLLARRLEELEKVKNQTETNGAIVRVFPVDVTDFKAVKSAAENLTLEFGKIDMLIANAGIAGKTVSAWKINPDDFSEVIKINLLGAVNSVAAVLPGMYERRNGHLVAISSLAGFRGLPKSAAYCASKSAMTTFFESLRIDLLKSRIHVTIIQPGFIKTPLTAGRKGNMPFLMELDVATSKIIKAIEKRKKFYAFPWQLATLVKLGKIMPAWLYDKIVEGRNYRE